MTKYIDLNKFQSEELFQTSISHFYRSYAFHGSQTKLTSFKTSHFPPSQYCFGLEVTGSVNNIDKTYD